MTIKQFFLTIAFPGTLCVLFVGVFSSFDSERDHTLLAFNKGNIHLTWQTDSASLNSGSLVLLVQREEYEYDGVPLAAVTEFLTANPDFEEVQLLNFLRAYPAVGRIRQL